MKHLLIAFAILSLMKAHACLWDSDTLRDEVQQKPELFDLITGQFAHHGAGYYQCRIARLSALEAPTVADRNDLAVTFIRLEEWEKAAKLLEANLAEIPDDYFTLSNLGVMEKKRGNPAKAATWIAKALAIKPEGHLGLGDWYLKMLEYRADRIANQKTLPTHNFLGESYTDKPPLDPEVAKMADFERSGGSRKMTAREEVRFEKLKRMIENDQTFADGFFVLGRFLSSIGDPHLGYLCFERARLLKHPREDLIKAAIQSVVRNGQDYDSSKTTYKKWLVTRKASLEAAAKQSLANAAVWLKQFQETEAALAKKQGDAATTPDLVETEMKKKGLERKRLKK